MLPRKMEKTTQINPDKAILYIFKQTSNIIQHYMAIITSYTLPISCVQRAQRHLRRDPQKLGLIRDVTQSETVPGKYYRQ